MLEPLTDFHFLRPTYLWLLFAIAGLALFFSQQKPQQRSWNTQIDKALIPYLLDNPVNVNNSRQSNWLRVLCIFSAIICVLSLSGPSWEKKPQPVYQGGNTLIVIADLTLSMHAQDIAPSRLTRLRYKLLELFKQRKEGETALIVYSGDAHVVSPLTEDSKTITSLVPALSPEIMPSIGSNAIAAFTLAFNILEQSSSSTKRIAWFTDELPTGQSKELQTLLNKHSVELFIIGIGTKEGGPVPLPSGKFLKDASSAKPVTAKFNASPLIELANNTNGYYLSLRTDNSDINMINAENSATVFTNSLDQSSTAMTKAHDLWLDRGAWIIPLLLPALLLSFRRGWLLSLFYLTIYLEPQQVVAQNDEQHLAQQRDTTQGHNASSLWVNLWKTKDQQALDAYKNGDYAKAGALFENNDWRATANFYNSDYKAAQQSFSNAISTLKSQDADSQPLAANYYNQGHALAHNGKLEQALKSYEKALEYSPDFKDAKTAKTIVEKMLKQQQQQEKQQEQSNDNQQSSEQSDQQNKENSDSPSSQQQNTSDPNKQNEQDTEETNSDQQTSQAESDAINEQEDKAQESSATADNPEESSLPQIHSTELADEQKQQALEQWLRQVDSDPAGLLRRKFQYERSLREHEGTVIDQSENNNIW